MYMCNFLFILIARGFIPMDLALFSLPRLKLLSNIKKLKIRIKKN